MDHGCLGCNRLETGPTVTLVTGAVVCSFCEAFRAECEAQFVLSLPTKDQRREYLAKVSRRRGDAAGNQLADLVRLVHSHNRQHGKT
jgi:hypothetical protein